MLTISAHSEGTTLVVVLAGRLDILTSELFLNEMRAVPTDVRDLSISLQDVSYVSIDGLRALLVATKMMAKRRGTCTLTNVVETIRRTFQTMGLQNAFTIA